MPDDFQSGVSAEEEAAIKEVLNDLMNMTEVERADLIDELTRKAFVLMEAGEIESATKQLQSITRISAAFQHLQKLQGGEEKKPKKMTDDEFLGIRSQGEVLTQMQRELHREDFSHIFGGQARWANFIGAW